MINYGQHCVDEHDIEAVVNVLKNGLLTQGPMVTEFERTLCKYTGAPYAIAVNSGTSALHVACLALNIKKGDLVWTSPISFVASSNCARYCGADIDFIDIDPTSKNIDIESLTAKLKTAEKSGKLPKAIVVVHFAGLSCEMRKIHELMGGYGVQIIEDASHALGAIYNGKPVGNCEYSDACIFSFHPVKSITSAEGGAMLCRSEKLSEKARAFASHGIIRDKNSFKSLEGAPWEYEQHSLGFNYRLSDIHAALGIGQMKKLDNFIDRRRALASKYNKALVGLPLKLPSDKALEVSSWHLYVVELETHSQLEVYQKLCEKGIRPNVHYIPIHLQPYYRELGFRKGDFPKAEQYYSRALTLPLYPSLTGEQQDNVISVMHEVLE